MFPQANNEHHTVRICQSLKWECLVPVLCYSPAQRFKKPQLDTLSNQPGSHKLLTKPTIAILEATVTRPTTAILEATVTRPTTAILEATVTRPTIAILEAAEGCKWSWHPLGIHPPDLCTCTYRHILGCTWSGCVGANIECEGCRTGWSSSYLHDSWRYIFCYAYKLL